MAQTQVKFEEIINEHRKKNRAIWLNLGCFNRKIWGMVNIDCRESVNPDYVADLSKLDGIPNGCINGIYSCHSIEHIERKKVIPTLKRWYEVLTKGGQVYVATPDMEAVCEHYIYHKNLRLLYSALGGSQNYPEDFHFSHFDFKTLKEQLEEVGFSNVERYDRWATQWAYVDDYSAAYAEHLNKNSKLMSLNVTAMKI